MVLGVRQPTQRRASYRRLRGEENHERISSNGENSSLDLNQGMGAASPRAASMPSEMLGSGGGGGRSGGDPGGFAVDSKDNDNSAAANNLWGILSSTAATDSSSLLHEAWLAFREGMWYVLLTTMLGAALSLFAVVHLSSHKPGTGATDTPRLPARRIPPAEEQTILHDSRMLGATTIHLGKGTRRERRPVILQGGSTASEEGHLRLPDEFYQGLHFGVSAWDTWGEKLKHEENERRNRALRGVLEALDPQPSAIHPTTFEDGVEGFTVAFSAAMLGSQEQRSVRSRSDPVWARVEGAVLAAARRYQQLIVMKWYPKVWGPGHERDENLHTSILQEVLPTRTGLRKLASTVVVYRVAVPAAVAFAAPAETPTGPSSVSAPARPKKAAKAAKASTTPTTTARKTTTPESKVDLKVSRGTSP